MPILSLNKRSENVNNIHPCKTDILFHPNDLSFNHLESLFLMLTCIAYGRSIPVGSYMLSDLHVSIWSLLMILIVRGVNLNPLKE